MKDGTDFSERERSDIFDLVLGCIQCDHRFDAIEAVLRRIGVVLEVSSITVFQFRHPVSLSDPLIGVRIGAPVDIVGLRTVLARWQSNQIPIHIPINGGIANQERQQASPWLMHGHCDALGTTTLVCVQSWNPRAGHSALLRLIAFHMHELLSRALRADQFDPLFTAAERKIIHHLLVGKSNKQIASALGKSEATVRNQLQGIFSKLRVNRRLEAIRKLEYSIVGSAP